MMDHASAAHAATFEYVLVFAAAIVLVWTLILALRYTVDPRETDAGHIKHRILLDEVDEVEEGRPR
jgi:hypothetical protein